MVLKTKILSIKLFLLFGNSWNRTSDKTVMSDPFYRLNYITLNKLELNTFSFYFRTIGFEPMHNSVKSYCLSTWPRPIFFNIRKNYEQMDIITKTTYHWTWTSKKRILNPPRIPFRQVGLNFMRVMRIELITKARQAIILPNKLYSLI